ncbi:protein of unknown function [Burkholderia multivorans]
MPAAGIEYFGGKRCIFFDAI